MPEFVYRVTVEKSLEDLIPRYLENRQKEVETLREALSVGDFERLRQIGHRMVGVGSSYGFDHVSELGKRFQDTAGARRSPDIEALLADYCEYLSRLEIVY